MEKILKNKLLPIVILSLFCGYLFFFQLGSLALTDPDETFYAETAKEMLNRPEWATPYLYGKAQFEKPILFYWLVELSFKMFGVNEFAARLPSAVSGLIGVIMIYLLGSLLFNKRASLLSAMILATNVEYIVLSRACITDMTLFALMLSGVTFFFYGRFREKKHFYALSAASFALAVLTKGPIAIILPVITIIGYFFLVKERGIFKKIPFLSMSAVFLLVAAPWYILTYKTHGREFIDAFFGFQNITRFLESEHKMGSQFYYNLPLVFAGFFPWSAFLPVALWQAFKKTTRKSLIANQEKQGIVFLLTWFAVIFIFFSISSTKLPTYIFPCWISLALVTAMLFDDFLKEGISKPLSSAVKVSYYILMVALVIGGIVGLIFINFDYPVMLKSSAIAAAFLIFGFMLSLAAFLYKKYSAAFILIIFSIMLFLYPLSKFVMPQIERYETSKEIAQKLLFYMKPGESLGSESHYRAGLAFYTGSFPVDLDKHHMLVEFLSRKDRVWFVLKEKNHRQLYELDTKPFCKKPSYVVYKIDKRTVITNEVPEDGKYILKRERKE